VLAITIKRLRINRDWAISDSAFVDRALTNNYASENKQEWKDTRWHLDAEKQIASLEKAPEHLKNFTIQLHLMLGCVGVAPNPWRAPVQTQDSGSIGGNMDFNGITEGATVFLPVQQPGALLYLGDAHAVQGDGEFERQCTGNCNGHRVRSRCSDGKAHRRTARGKRRLSDGHGPFRLVDGAFREATSELASWLQADYKLSTSETASVLGTSIEYKISEVADRNVGVVAKIRKSSLLTLAVAK
jgi:amidase